ncbi:MAG TPA: aspartyl/asparaginyl beta-hydroxylase domain-containing protein [Steroidobacteraceae bacterium]|nr:aspartyl/asparaginyl beta-hydroxylase domain-containing protein [Steroidobacteraceae bacterium]
MTNANATPADNAAVLSMIQASRAAGAAGRRAEAEQLLARVAQLAPSHPAVLNELGLTMMQRGEPASARELFERATRADPGHPSLWSNLAASLHALKAPEELEAIERALALEPRHLASLLQKGTYIEERGDARSAARVYRNALATIRPGETPPESVGEVLRHAREVIARDEAALGAALEEKLAGLRARHGGGSFRRVDRCVELLTGKRNRFSSQPTFMYFPEIPDVEFFERGDFPWLDAVEAASDDIRAELLSVLISDREGLEPYVAHPEGIPLDQWKDLNKSRRWSAYFLWNQSVPQPAHMARCPRTVEVLKKVPQVEIERRAPTAYFSILAPGTRIPPHTGVSNTRAIVHLPLIVPEKCGFRVGSRTREWIPGQAWVFDDTIEHEAWNLSDSPRAILIFDVWNPFLSPAERAMVKAATEVVVSYYNLPDQGPA